MTTQSELLLVVRERLDEATEHQWNDDELRRLINEGAKDIARKTESLLDRDDITAVAGTQEYTMSTDTIRVNRVEWRPDGDDQVYPLEYRDFNNADGVWWTGQIQTEGTPVIYTMWGFPPSLKLIAYPTPSVAGVFKVYYYRLPVELAVDGSDSGTTVEIPEGWDDVVADYAEFRALRKDRDPEWQTAKAIYDEHVLDLNATSRRWTDQAGMIVAGTSFVPSWLYGEG